LVFAARRGAESLGRRRRRSKRHHNLSTAQRRSTLEEGARKEGEIIWYTSMGLIDFPKIVGAFEKTFPYVKIRTNRLSQSSLM
jgi:hypothetical protein